MKKEGTGKPRNPDISLDANVKMDKLHFKEVPEAEVYFQGNSRRNSVWGSRREGLPDEVQEGVVYRSAGVRLRIASEVVDSIDSDSSFKNEWFRQRKGKDEPMGAGAKGQRARN